MLRRLHWSGRWRWNPAAPTPGAALDGARVAEFLRGYSISASYGHARFGDGVSEYGLRFAELAIQATPSLRFWPRYDVGLARNNVALVWRNVNADAHFVGGVLSYGGRYSTRSELGRRKLDVGVRHNVMRGEQALRLDSGVRPKFGVWIGDSDDTRAE